MRRATGGEATGKQEARESRESREKQREEEERKNQSVFVDCFERQENGVETKG